MIQLVPVSQVDAVWPFLARGMAIACKKGGGQYTPEWLWTICRRGEAFLAVSIENGEIRAGGVLQAQTWTGRQVLNVLALCGTGMRGWLLEAVEFTRANFTAQGLVFEGRPGWGRFVPGVRVVRHVYEVGFIDVR